MIPRAWALVRREIDADVVLLILAVALIAAGCWSWWRPGAFVVPGLVLLWIALPTRTRFVHREGGPTGQPTGQVRDGRSRNRGVQLRG